MSAEMNTQAQETPFMELDQIVDLEKYPINDLENPTIKEVIKDCRERLDFDGCALIKDFLKPESIQRMQAEAERLYDQTYWSKGSHTPYFNKDDETLPADHPKRYFQERSSGYINSDVLETNSDLRFFYNADIVTRFIGECLNVSDLSAWDDPLACNPYSVMDSGNYFPWHFDGNEFTVSLLVQESESGGIFEYKSDLRNPVDENFEGVKEILNGGRDGVNQLDLRPGDMQIFKGRFSMHRVTKITGDRRRVIALPSYVTDPYSVNRPAHSIHLYGRAEPIHYERENYRVDGLTD